jgi:uridine nucleosidase
VYPGASKPLILPAKHDPEIHGEDGLGGVEGLPGADSCWISDRFAVVDGDGGERVRAVEGMCEGIRSVWRKGRGERVTVVATGPMTNVALFVSCYEDLVAEGGAVEEIVFMGGGVGLGNRSAVAEYNVLTDR